MGKVYLYGYQAGMWYAVDLDTLERSKLSLEEGKVKLRESWPGKPFDYMRGLLWSAEYGPLDFPLFLVRSGLVYFKEFMRGISFVVEDLWVYLCGKQLIKLGSKYYANNAWSLCYLYKTVNKYYMQIAHYRSGLLVQVKIDNIGVAQYRFKARTDLLWRGGYPVLAKSKSNRYSDWYPLELLTAKKAFFGGLNYEV